MLNKKSRSKLGIVAPAAVAGALLLSSTRANAAGMLTAAAVKIADKALGFGVNTALSSAFGFGTYDLSETSLETIATMMSDIVDEAFDEYYMSRLMDAADADALYQCTSDLALSDCITNAEATLSDIQLSANDWQSGSSVEGVPQFILMTSLELAYVNELIALNELDGNSEQAKYLKQTLGGYADNALIHLDSMEVELEDLVYGLDRSNSLTNGAPCSNSGYDTDDYNHHVYTICIETLGDSNLCDTKATVVSTAIGGATVAVFAEHGSSNDCGVEYGGFGDFATEVLRTPYLDQMHTSLFGEGDYDVFRNMLEWYAEYDNANYEYVGNHDWSPIQKGLADVDTTWTTIHHESNFLNPVVIAGPPSTNGEHPVMVETRNADADSFEIRLVEFDYQDGNHSTEQVSWMVVEGGMIHTDDYGNSWYAGTVETEPTGFYVDSTWVSLPDELQSFHYQAFLTPQEATPSYEAAPGLYFPDSPAVFRISGPGYNGFSVRRQEEEAQENSSQEPWTVGYLVVTTEEGIDNANSKALLKGEDMFYSTTVLSDETWRDIIVDVYDESLGSYEETFICETMFMEETSSDDEVAHSNETAYVLVTHDDAGNELLFAQDYTFAGSDPGNIRWQ